MFDISTDPQLTLIAEPLQKLGGFFEEIGEEDLQRFGLNAEIPASAYAHTSSDGKALPCHNKAACFISRAFFEAQRSSLDSKVASQVDANLKHFEELHGLTVSEIEAVQGAIKEAQAPKATPQRLSYVLESKYRMQPDSLRAGELMLAARELKTAGARTKFLDSWVFDQPIANPANQIRALCDNVAHNNPDLAEVVAKVAAAPPRQVNSMLPELAETLHNILGSVSAVHEKLAGLRTCTEPDIRLCGRDIPVDRVAQQLPKIAALTDAPVYTGKLQLLSPRWSEILETTSEATQRQILNCLG